MEMCGIVYTDENEKWDSIVKSFKQYEVFYLVGYVHAFEELRNEKAMLFWYDDGETRAINVVMKRDIAAIEEFENVIEEGKFFDLQTPYGYGGMIIEGKNKEKVWEEYTKICKTENIVCEFVRFSLFTNGETYYDGYTETRTHNIVRNLELSDEDLYADFEHKVRKNLKKAERNELKFIVDEEGKYFEEFLKIYYDTMKRNNASDEYYFPRSFFEKFLQMPTNAAWFHVQKDGQIISTELVIYNENNCYSYLGGTYADYFEYRPNELLKVGIMLWAKQKDIKNFVLGGGYGTDDGIFKYKKSFAPQGVRDFYIGHRIMMYDMYNKLVEIREQSSDFDRNTLYFPKYRG